MTKKELTRRIPFLEQHLLSKSFGPIIFRFSINWGIELRDLIYTNSNI
jgi:hypothetical protein